MPPNVAFTDEEYTITDDGAGGRSVTVTGFSPIITDSKLVHRRVTIQQGDDATENEATLGEQAWDATLTLPDGITAGDATALGIELYLTSTAEPMYASFVWSQEITLK